ncbi:MAG: HAD family hydrolase [Patescibacteria group bacterium]|nr:HAD family hydrolase [Patescibacteria group bacterium]
MQPVIFLDRDGVINVDHGYVHRVEDWEFTPQAVEALQMLQQYGFALAIATNQSGIGHHRYPAADMHAVNRHMVNLLAPHGITIAAIAFCPHRRDGDCTCRKPKTGMTEQIERQLGPIDYPRSWSVGDKLADIEFGRALGTHRALIRSRYWQESDLKEKPDCIVNSLFEAAKIITQH